MTAGPVSHTIQKLLFWEEPNRAAFAVDHSGTLGDFDLVPVIEGTLDFDPLLTGVDPGQAVHHIYDWREEIHGPKRWTLSFQVPLAPTGTLAGDTETATSGIIGKLLKVVMGGEALGVGTTVSTNWGTAAGGDVTVATSLNPGMAIAWADANGRLHARELKSKASSTLATKIAFPGTPQATDLIRPAATYYLHKNPTTAAQFIVMGEEEDDRYIFMGGAGTVSLNLPLTGDQVPTLSFEFVGRRWEYGEDGATDLSLEAFNPEAYADYSPITDHVGELIEQAVGTSTLSQTPVKGLSFDLTLENREITAPHAEEGLLHHRRVRQNGPTIQGTLMPSFFEDLTRMKRRDNKDDVYLAYSFGTTATSGVVLITASTVQYTGVDREDGDAVAVESITWKGRNDAETVEATATDLGLSCFRIHIIG